MISQARLSLKDRIGWKNVEIIYSVNGVLEVKIKAPRVIKVSNIENPYIEMPEMVNVSFYDIDGEPESFLVADYGISHEKTEIMFAKGNVKLSNNKDEKMFAEELYWNQKEKTIYSDKFVRIETKEEVIYGEGFVSNESSRLITFF